MTDEKTDLGGHESHGGREDLGPAASPELKPPAAVTHQRMRSDRMQRAKGRDVMGEYRPMEVLKRLHEALDSADLPGIDSHLSEYAAAVSWAMGRLHPVAVCGWTQVEKGRCVRLKDHDGRCQYEDGTFSEKERVEIEADFAPGTT